MKTHLACTTMPALTLVTLCSALGACGGGGDDGSLALDAPSAVVQASTSTTETAGSSGAMTGGEAPATATVPGTPDEDALSAVERSESAETISGSPPPDASIANADLILGGNDRLVADSGTSLDTSALLVAAVQKSNGGRSTSSSSALAMTTVGMSSISAMESCTATLFDDFIDAGSWSLRRLMPSDCKIVGDDPVSFSWPTPADKSAGSPWTLTIAKEEGTTVLSVTSTSPRTTLPSPLGTGRFRWQVSYKTNAGAVKASSWRRFEVKAGQTLTYVMPSATKLLETLIKHGSPRVLPLGTGWASVAAAAKTGDYKASFPLLNVKADEALKAAILAPPTTLLRSAFGSDGAQAQALNALMHSTNSEVEYIEALGFAWRFTNSETYLAALKRRALALAAWDPQGSSSETQQPQANRNIYLALAIATDLAGSSFSATERAAIAAAFEARMGATMQAVAALDREPYRSFENTSIQYATQALLMVAGLPDFPNSGTALQQIWPLYLAQYQADGEDDGGSGSSIAYAWYELKPISRTAATLLLAANVDVTQRSQARKLGDFLMAATAPNQTQLNAFGDGLEVSSLYANYAYNDYRLYAAVTRQPHHEWYWRLRSQNVNLAGYLTPLHYLVAALNRGKVTPAAPSQNDYVFEDVGIAALHNNAGLSSRSTLFFRSSRFGSYNHAHADQNAIAFTSHGKSLLIGSGYYPYYNSPHHATDTRATRYKNAVTFDGGIGQAEPVPTPTAPGKPVSSMDTRGQIVNSFSREDLAVVTGDATLAYRGWDSRRGTWQPLLTSALRSAAYLKSAGVIVVYDWLSSSTPRRWEWNYHGVAPFTGSGSNIVANNAPAKACIDQYGPAGSFTLTSGFDVAPETNAPTQYHARYTVTSPTASAAMVTVIREDCKTHAVKVDSTGSTASVTVDGQSISFDRAAVNVGPSGT